MHAEIAHHQYRVALATGGVKAHKLPPPLHIPRPTPWAPPTEDTPQQPRRKVGRRHAETVSEVVAALSAGFGPSRR